nr:hypothetical protein [Tanacetum cinerariifolium]
MGGSSSQPRTNQVHSPINAFSLEDLYMPDFSDPLQDNTGYWQPRNSYEASAEQVATSPTKKKKKATRNRQKRMVQSDDAPRQTPWKIEKQNRAVRKRTYDMVIEKWKTVRPAVIRFCGVYNNIMRMSPESGAEDDDYVQRAMIHYQIEPAFPLNFAIVGRLMVTEMGAQEKQERLAFLEIKRREVECRERELEQQDMRFYLQPYNHLVGDQRKAMDEIRDQGEV